MLELVMVMFLENITKHPASEPMKTLSHNAFGCKKRNPQKSTQAKKEFVGHMPPGQLHRQELQNFPRAQNQDPGSFFHQSSETMQFLILPFPVLLLSLCLSLSCSLKFKCSFMHLGISDSPFLKGHLPVMPTNSTASHVLILTHRIKDLTRNLDQKGSSPAGCGCPHMNQSMLTREQDAMSRTTRPSPRMCGEVDDFQRRKNGRRCP